MEQLNKQWKQCLDIIQDNLNRTVFDTWFAPLVPVSFKDKELVLQVPSQFYYEYIEARKKNPFVQALRRNVPTDTLLQARGRIKDLLSSRLPVFDVNSSKYARHILAHYNSLDDKASEKFLIKTLTVQEHHKSQKFLSTSKVLFPLYPVAKINMLGKEKRTRAEYENTMKALNRFISDYTFLKGVLTTDRYYMALAALLDGHDVQSVFLAEIQLDQVFTNPIRFHIQFDHGYIFRQGNHIHKAGTEQFLCQTPSHPTTQCSRCRPK